MSIGSQLLKGVLEGCILAIMARETVYGYELAVKLQTQGIDVSEGSIYPILLRLQKEELIIGEIKKSPHGPNRKYYQLTDKGKKSLQAFRLHWESLKYPVDRLLEEKEEK
ncbi:PadR family transcriptional regulator [Amphibacillus cookii]|uniref:PadR family transcriptional regulator n=1 Tax=Amphibacillus cookii TaxID=767787 RepID=UPI00195EF949|nr:PadR family transcriptional regulator [Amphibacillus cookii]MBM7541378.1 PadR family transcriptional regulator PadR [Amphibacillus cookii]